jgi:adenosylcobinamide kinase/adenosylcobinamide-phosphate guanylyltransferase
VKLMFVFVSGPVRSGKSTWAEECALSFARAKAGAPLVYLATARVHDQEMKRRVLRHQATRKDKGFETLERETDVSLVPRFAPGSIVLLECLGTLLANEMFETDQEYPRKREGVERVVSKICGDILLLKARVADLLVVSNDIFSDGVTYDEATESYRQALGKLHLRLAQGADLAVECVFGQVIAYKDRREASRTGHSVQP